MASAHVVFPGALTTRTGGYEYDRRMIAELKAHGWDVELHALDPSFPFPSPEALRLAGRALAGIDAGALVLVDGLALGAMPDIAEAEASRLRLVALVHHPLAAETGLDPAAAARLFESERRALAAVRHVVVTSAPTASALAPYGVTGARVSVVEPGTEPAPLAHGSGAQPVALLTVASVTPRKGLDVLADALASVADCDWTWTCVGSTARDEAHARAVASRLAAHGLTGRVTFAGEADAQAVRAQYDRADVFVLPTHYEGYGMVVAEAIARGLPVVATATGGIPALLADGCGLVVPPGDTTALASALRQVLGDAAVRERLRASARRVRARLPDWSAQAGRLGAVLRRVAHDGL